MGDIFRKSPLVSAAVSLVIASTVPTAPAIAGTAGGASPDVMSPHDYDRAFLQSLVSRIRMDPGNIEALVAEARAERPDLASQIDDIHAFLAETPLAAPVLADAPLATAPEEEVMAEEEDENDDYLFMVYGGLAFAAIGGGTIAALGSGGGGSDGKKDDPEPQPEPEPYDEYLRSGGLERMKAIDAYARGHSGEGVTVAVVDEGFRLDHPEFEGKWSSPYNAADGIDQLASGNHGTHVAGIIGARKDGEEMHGVAWGSRMIPISVGVGDMGRGEVEGRAFEHALANGASVINNSWGINGMYAGDRSRADMEAELPHLTDAIGKLPEHDAIAVWAAGNDGADEPLVLAALPNEFPELKGHWVAVTAVDGNNNRAVFANACGSAADWCLSAPGTAIYSAAEGGYASYSGTTMATPHVSGAIAVLRSAFPYLEAPEILDILFETADELGPREIYGHGMVNLERATRPVGKMSIPAGSSVAGKTHDLGGTSIRTAAAFGDGVAAALAERDVLALDSYDRGYRISMGDMVSSSGKPSRGDYMKLMKLFGGFEERSASTVSAGPLSVTSSARLDTSGMTATRSEWSRMSFRFSGTRHHVELALNPDASRSFGLRDSGFGNARLVAGDAFDQPHLALMETGYGSSFGFDLSPRHAFRMGIYTGNLEGEGWDGPGQAPSVTGAVAELRTNLADGVMASLSAGAVHEEGSLLGSVSRGAFGESVRSDTLFATAGAVLDLGQDSRLTLSGTLGRTDFIQDGMIRGGRDIITSAFGVGFATDNLLQEGDSLALAVSQPLRVEGGKVSMKVPTLRGMDGGIGYRKASFTPEPTAREINLQASYALDVMDGVTAGVGTSHRINPGHSARRDPETIGLVSLSLSF